MRKFVLLLLISIGCLGAAQKKTALELIGLSTLDPEHLKDGVEATFDAKELAAGTAYVSHGADFFFAVECTTEPNLFIDHEDAMQMTKVPGGTNLWYAATKIGPPGTLHSFIFTGMGGRAFGGRTDVPAFDANAYQHPGVPEGTLSEKMIHTSKLYDGMKSEWWIYVPAQYDAKVPAALMIFQDGGGYLERSGNKPILNMIDNLIAQKKIPTMICVFINPGDISGSPGTPTFNFVKAYSDKWQRTLKDSMRSTLYDTVSDRYPRFLRDEIIPEVAAKYSLRKDAYSRAITGSSSGGICAFNAAWQMPDLFSRVISWIGSFTSIQWKEDPKVPDGGQDYPEKVLREPKRNIRAWLQDGANDQENPRYGSWPLQNIKMANALHLKEYDYRFSFGQGTHNSAHGAAEFPEEMIWLWRDYDPAKTEQQFAQDPAEKKAEPYRVKFSNR
jgi:enterochelin esterase family protein